MSATNFDLCRDAFKSINEFKRSRTLSEQARQDGDISKAIFHELKTYKAFDAIELYLRAIQSNERNAKQSIENEGESLSNSR